ncbi:MAG: O-antigen ligase C-terminal domain-containing protein [Gammaproteobacteria bacterium]|jgi:O-antigen polymerase|nr:O-antigen ligase C-terminal domain-containing protein [Gammaproteobacteria bacterium]
MPLISAPLCLMAVALPFLFAYTDSPISNFWPLVTSWVCGGVLLAVGAWSARGAYPGRSRAVEPESWGRLLAGGLVLAAVLSSIIGLVQYAAGDVGLGPWIHPSQPGQAAGNLRQRNQQATLLALGAWALLWFALHGRARLLGLFQARPGRPAAVRGQPRVSAHWPAIFILATLAAAGAATASRTGAVQWLLVVSLLVLWQRTGAGPALRLALLGAGLYLVAAWVLPELLWRVQGVHADALFHRFTDDSQPCTSRRALWSNMLTLMAQKPWVGWGWGELDYAHYVTLFPGERFCVLLDNAHNLPLQLAVELGLPAAVLLCGAFGVWCLGSRPWHEDRPERQLAWGVLAIIGLHSLLEYPLWYGPFQIVALFAMALLLWPQSPLRARGAAPSLVLGAGAVLIWGVCGLAAWDYFRVSQLYKANTDRAAAYRDNVQSKVTHSLLFADQLAFAQLTTTGLTRENAQRVNQQAKHLLHYSPEPRVIQAVIESAVMLGKDDEAAFHMKRYRIAYPKDYDRWMGAAGGKASAEVR